ncbi:helix-turn-helix domain-containing protein [Streptomyces laurentii]|uniref:helix-turn-helix domain-containing protein n=1 Tax=Streptomyces laurentii TaxID=39478 RepID=UPI0036C3DC3C
MAARKEIDGSASVPQFYGKELRYKREEAGLTLEKLVDGSFYSITYLSEIEHGQRRMPIDLARHADRKLNTDGFFERRCKEVRKARRTGLAEYFADVLELEKRAREIEEWSPMLVPGPLQLEPYIRAVVKASRPFDTDEEVQAKVTNRRDRAWVFEEREGPGAWAILDESILQKPLVGANDMAEQLAHIAAVARRRTFIPQILPCNAGAHPFMMGTAWMMSFENEPPLMYTEGMYSGQVIDDPELYDRYSKAYDRLRAAALPPEVSLRLIEQAAEDYRNGTRPTRYEHSGLA